MQQQNEITKLYKGVIEEVIRNVRNDFVNMGVDEQVLYDLQMLWEQKLMDYKIVSPAEYFGGGVPVLQHSNPGNGGTTLLMNPHVVHGAHHMHGGEVGLNVLANGALAAGQAQGFNPYGANVATDNYGYIRPNNRTTYYHPSQGYFEANAPTAANLPNMINPQHQQLQQQQLQQQQLQQQQLQQQAQVHQPQKPHPQTQTQSQSQSQSQSSKSAQSQQNPRRYDGSGDVEDTPSPSNNVNDPEDIIKLLYTNGEEEVVLENNTINQTSPADDDEINSDLDDDDDEDDKDADAEGYDETGTMDENVVLCQYEKVNRTRNKWRCVFKSGIIHINGNDYVFSKANGEFEW